VGRRNQSRAVLRVPLVPAGRRRRRRPPPWRGLYGRRGPPVAPGRDTARSAPRAPSVPRTGAHPPAGGRCPR